MLIPCPYCGPREVDEFTYIGDGARRRPPDDDDFDAWFAWVYLRDNPRGPHTEIWHHTHGCRQHLIVRRDTVDHAIADVRPARGGMP